MHVQICACVCIWRPEIEVASTPFSDICFFTESGTHYWVRPAGPKHQRPSYFASPVLGLMALGSIPGLLNVIARNPNSDLDACIVSSYCLPPIVSILF